MVQHVAISRLRNASAAQSITSTFAIRLSVSSLLLALRFRLPSLGPASTSHAPTSHASTSHAPTSHASTSHASTSHASTSHASTSHASTSHASTSHASTSHASTSHASTSHASTSHAPTSHASTSHAPTSHALGPTYGPLSSYMRPLISFHVARVRVCVIA